MISLPGLQLFSKPSENRSLPLLPDAHINQCGETTGLLSVVL